jgi:hypothetical protein
MNRTLARLTLFCLIGPLALLGGCAGTPTPVQIEGNGFCHPAQDLPAHKAVAPVPETATAMDDLYALLASERKQHAADDRDYNSLYSTCVGGSHDPSFGEE